MEGVPPALTERFLAAVALAQEAHGHVRRSGTEVPYLAHLLVVTGLVIEDDAILRVALADKVHNARSIVRDYREEGHVLWERFARRTAREQLWYYGGLLAFFEIHRPGPLTEDLLRAVNELTWLAARDDAQRSEWLWLWVDPDVHGRQAPDGWVQVRTPRQAIGLLNEFSVQVLSLHGAADASPVIRWLAEQERSGRDCWPEQRIAFHGQDEPVAIDEHIRAIDHHYERATTKGARGQTLNQRDRP